MVTTELLSNFFVVISFSEVLAFWVIVIIQIDNVECGATFVCITDIESFLLLLNFLCLSIMFFLHVLPSFEVSFIFLNSDNFEKLKFKIKTLIYLPPGVNNLLFPHIGRFSLSFLNCCKISVKSIILRDKMT